MKYSGIPEIAFFTSDIDHLEELREHYENNTESVHTMKNYVTDIMNHKIIPAYKNVQPDDYNAQNDIYNQLVNLCYMTCFSHPRYAGNVHPFEIMKHVVASEHIPLMRFRGALSEAYGRYILENMHDLVQNPQFACKALDQHNNTRKFLDLHAKSDATYTVTSINGQEMIRSVDFKNKQDRKEAGEIYSSLDEKIIDKTKVLALYDRDLLTNKLRRALRSAKATPVKGILIYMGLPQSFQQMHFTPSMIKADAQLFHDQLVASQFTI